MSATLLPPEIFDAVLEMLPVRDRFRLAVHFRRIHVRDQCLAVLPECTMDEASSRGNVDLLNWWVRSGRTLCWTDDAMDYASANGHVNVLDWWLMSGLECRYTPWGLGEAARWRRLDVLDWWNENSGQRCLECNWDYAFAQISTIYGQEVLDWFYTNKYSFLWETMTITL